MLVMRLIAAVSWVSPLSRRICSTWVPGSDLHLRYPQQRRAWALSSQRLQVWTGQQFRCQRCPADWKIPLSFGQTSFVTRFLINRKSIGCVGDVWRKLPRRKHSPCRLRCACFRRFSMARTTPTEFLIPGPALSRRFSPSLEMTWSVSTIPG